MHQCRYNSFCSFVHRSCSRAAFNVAGLVLPEVFSPFSNSQTNSFISFVVSDWSSVLELLDLPDLMGGLRGLRPQLKLGALQTRCPMLCNVFLQEVMSVLQSHCPKVNKGDVSALVSASSKFSTVMSTLTDMFIPSVYGVPRNKKLLLMVDSSFASADPDSLLFTPKMDQFLKKFDIDSYVARFERLTTFLQSQTLVDGSLSSSNGSLWKSEYPSFASGVVNTVSTHPMQSVTILAFRLESGCLKDFPSFRYIWVLYYVHVPCSLGSDITESHHFESEKFNFDFPISPAEF